ncbi:hypothetical protein K3A88_36475, partial [Streptomyces geysiriensis]|nr:hypothetical protein [Streptomyces geysiriensis]
MRSLHDLTLRPRRWSRALALALVLPLAGCATGTGNRTRRPRRAPRRYARDQQARRRAGEVALG